MSAPTPMEHGVIVHCLAGIRRRLWSVRLVERCILAIQWGAIIGLCLGGNRLLREPLPWENFPWTSLLLALLPLIAAGWLFRAAKRFQSLGLSVMLIHITAGLTAFLSVAMLVLVLAPLGKVIPVWCVPTATIIAFVSIAAATVRMIDNHSAAIYVDQQVGLHERVSTALEMLETSAKSPLENVFRAPVIASALAACQQVRTAKVGYHRLDSRIYALAALVAIAAASLTLIPPMPARAISVRKPSTIIVKQSKDLREVLKELEDKKLPNDKITQEQLKPLQNAITQLQNGNMSQIESNAILNEAKEQMKREQEAMAASDKVQDMLRQMGQTQDLAKAAEAVKGSQMQQAKGDAAAAEQQKSADQALKNAAETLANRMKSGQMSDAEKQDLANQLQKAADKAAADPQLQKDLQNAADAAKSGDANQLSQSMQSAGQRMGQQSAGSQMSQQAVKQAMSEIDKMQNGAQGSQSTMAQNGNQGNQGDQGGKPGDNQGQNQNGSAQASNGSGKQPGPDGSNSASPGPGPMNGQEGSNGSTMLEGRSGPGDQKEGPTGTVKTFVRLYDANATDTNGTQQKVGSFINPIHPASGTMDVMGTADEKDSQIKTYADVLPEARKQAIDELTRQEYPPQYQDMVREFYNDTPRK